MKDQCVLKDCGFCEEKARRYMAEVENENYQRQLQLLEEQRRIMLDEMHLAASKVDCIDFLINECKKKIKGGQGRHEKSHRRKTI